MVFRTIFDHFLLCFLQQSARSDRRPTSRKHCLQWDETHYRACAPERNDDRKTFRERSRKRLKIVRKNDRKCIENATETSIEKTNEKSIENRSKNEVRATKIEVRANKIEARRASRAEKRTRSRTNGQSTAAVRTTGRKGATQQ